MHKRTKFKVIVQIKEVEGGLSSAKEGIIGKYSGKCRVSMVISGLYLGIRVYHNALIIKEVLQRGNDLQLNKQLKMLYMKPFSHP